MAGAVDRRTFVKASLAAGVSIIVRPLAAVGQPAVAGRRAGPGLRVAANGGDRGAPHRWLAEGHRRQDLRRRFPGGGHARLAAPDRPRDAHQDARCDAHVRGHRSRDARPRARARSRGAGGRPCGGRDHRAGVLCRRSAVPRGQDAALSRPAGGAADLERRRALRAGAAGDQVHVRHDPLRRQNRACRGAALCGRALRARRRSCSRRR